MEEDYEGVSPKMQAVKWEWTPELLELRQRGLNTLFNYHPDLGANLNEDFVYRYSPSLPLPAYDDKRGMMRFCGLSDGRIDMLLEEYSHKLGEDTQPPFEIVTYGDRRMGAAFPVLSRLVDLFTHREEGDLFDYEESYEGYIKKGVQQGLRPEFALCCGLPEYEKANFSTFPPPEPNWYKHSPMYYVDEIFKRNYARLEILWSEKLIADGIVKQTEHGCVLTDDQVATGQLNPKRKPDGVNETKQGLVKAY